LGWQSPLTPSLFLVPQPKTEAGLKPVARGGLSSVIAL
jgi:hypothetical protein